MQQLSKQPAFELGQIVATPGALAALQKAGQQPGEFLARHVNHNGAVCPTRTAKKTTTA
jgi:hypothetical protein